jgi:ATP-independent RNA helicase DbpA
MSNTPFSSLPLPQALLSNLTDLGYEAMTTVQAQALPAVLAGQDVIAQAKTGSGKTATFGLGLLAQLDVKYFRVQSLILCPTRELADQVATELRKLARSIHNIKILTLCGGAPMRPQITSLEHGAHIIVGTPGRVMDHLDQGRLKLDDLRCLVLDEADRMLVMGFQAELDSVIAKAPLKRQTLMFSATYPDSIAALSARLLNKPVHIKVEEQHGNSSIAQKFFQVQDNRDRMNALRLLLLKYQGQSSIVFCTTKRETQEVADLLTSYGFSVLALHGDLDQKDRDQALVKFANGSACVLVATDVAARGLDIKDVPAVFNFDVPFNAEDYVHRIGRTGRAGASGLAVTLVSGSDARLVADIEKLIKKKIDLEAIEYEEDRPRGRINDGRRAWRESGEAGDPRDVIPAAVRERNERREPREHHRGFRPAVASRDPFFEKPYEPSNADTAPAWEAAAKSPARSSISANIKPKRKVAALFKAVQPETSTQ